MSKWSVIGASGVTPPPVPGTGGTWIEEVPVGVLDGVNKVFTISKTPVAGSLTLFLNIDQAGGTDFIISENVITFAVAPWYRDTGWFKARYQY